jgi:hypothetical protein
MANHSGRPGTANGDEADYLGRGGRVPYNTRAGVRRKVRQGSNRRARRTTRLALRTGQEA